MGSIRITRIIEGCSRLALLLLLICSTAASAQFTVTKSSFSNGKATGTDGVNTATSRVGAFGSLNNIEIAIDSPSVAASGIVFSNVLSHEMTVTFTPGNGGQRLAVMKAGSAPDFTPVNDVSYSGDLGNGISVAYSGSGSSFDLSQLLPNTTYFITIFEFNAGSGSTRYLIGGAPTASQTTLALPLVNVTSPINGSVGLNASLTITSKALAGASVYTIEISPNADFTNPKVRSGAVLTYNFDSLQYNTLYYTRVKTDLRVDYGKVTTFSTRTAESIARVTSPANLAVNVNTTLNIVSNPVLYASEYTIQLSETSDFAEIAFSVSGATPTLAFSGLKYNTPYYNRVYTNLSANPSVVGSFTTKSAASLAYVASPANGSNNIATSRTITANDFPGANSYTIQLSETSDFAVIAFEQTGPTRTLNFSGLKYNTLYYNRVSTDLSGGPGLVYSFMTRTAESLAYVTSPSNGQSNRAVSLTITSNEVPGAGSYTIQLSTSPLFTSIAAEVTGATRMLAFSGLAYNTTYYNRVTTDLATGYGAVYSFTTKTAESLAFVTGPADGAVNKPLALDITASMVPGATSYTIQLSTTPDFAAIAFEVTGPTRVLAFSGLSYNTTYYNHVTTDVTPGYGPVRSFTTLSAESIAYVTSPANNAVNVSVNPAVKSSNVPGAATYTIQLSLASNFSTIDFESTSASRTQNFVGLITGTKYYNRVRTNLTPNFGPAGNFTTAGLPPGGRVHAPLAVEETEPPLQEFEVRVYPNPFREKLVLYIESTDERAELAITDMSGRSVHRSQEKTNTYIEIDRPMAAGVYLLQVRTEQHSKVVRVVKLE